MSPTYPHISPTISFPWATSVPPHVHTCHLYPLIDKIWTWLHNTHTHRHTQTHTCLKFSTVSYHTLENNQGFKNNLLDPYQFYWISTWISWTFARYVWHENLEDWDNFKKVSNIHKILQTFTKILASEVTIKSHTYSFPITISYKHSETKKYWKILMLE